MRARLLARLVVLVVASGLLALPGTTASHTVDARSRPDLPAVAASAVAQHSRAEVLRYWTPARMRAAQPMTAAAAAVRHRLDSPPGQALASAPPFGPVPARTSSAVAAAPPRHGNVVVPRTVGKLFVRTKYGDRMCSAAIIRSKLRNQILTAAHCAHGGKYGRWYSHWVFVPQYDDGRARHGRWVGKRAYVPKRWKRHSDFTRDYAIIKLRKHNGKKIQQRLGGNGVRTGRGPWKWGVRIWGWPAQHSYDGEHGVMCQGKTSRYKGRKDAKMECPMTGGSSGGPWLLREKRRRHRGLIFAVTSRRTVSGTPYLLAAPLPKAFWYLKRWANP